MFRQLNINLTFNVIFLFIPILLVFLATVDLFLFPYEVSFMIVAAFFFISCLMFLKAKSYNRLSPIIYYPVVMSAYFFLGSTFASEKFLITNLQWQLYVVSIYGFYLGYHLVNSNFKVNKINIDKEGFKNSLNYTLLYFIFIVSISTNFFLWLKFGIPIFQENVDIARGMVTGNGYLGTISSAKDVVAVYFFALMLANIDNNKKYYYLLLLIFIIAILLLSGSRSGLLKVVIPSIFVYHFLHKNIKLRDIFVGVVLSILFIGAIGFYRLYAVWGEDAFDGLVNQGVNNGALDAILFFAFVELTTAVEGLSLILEKVPNEYDFYFGQLQLAPVLMPLPGVQEPPGMVFKQMVGGQWDGFGMAATMLAPMYADFSVFGVLLSMTAVSFFVNYSYFKCTTHSVYSIYWIIAYGFISYFLINGTRTNFVSFDVIWYLFVVFFLFLFSKRRLVI